jgi:hypothetical protein
VESLSYEYVVFKHIKESEFDKQEYCCTFETEDEAQLFIEKHNRKTNEWEFEYYWEEVFWKEDNQTEEMMFTICIGNYVVNKKNNKRMYKVIDTTINSPHIILQTRLGSAFVENIKFYRLATKGEIIKKDIKDAFIK